MLYSLTLVPGLTFPKRKKKIIGKRSPEYEKRGPEIIPVSDRVHQTVTSAVFRFLYAVRYLVKLNC